MADELGVRAASGEWPSVKAGVMHLVDLEWRQPRAHTSILRPECSQPSCIVSNKSDEVGTEYVATPKGIRNIVVTQLVLCLYVACIY